VVSWSVMDDVSTENRAAGHFLMVRSGGFNCAIPVAASKMIARSIRIVPLPGSAPRLLGLAQIDGEPVAVVDLHALCDPSGEPGGVAAFTVVVRQPNGAERLGLAIDEAFGLVDIEDAEPPADGDPAWVIARTCVSGRDVLILDPTRLFDDMPIDCNGTIYAA